MAPARFCTCLDFFKCHENCQQHKAIALKLFLNRSEVRIRTKITHILCLQMREQSVHISKLMFECSYFSSVSSIPIPQKKATIEEACFGLIENRLRRPMVKQKKRIPSE